MLNSVELPAGVMDESYAAARRSKPQHQFRLRSRAAVVAQSVLRFHGDGPVRLLEIGAADGRVLLELAGTLPYRELVGVEYSVGLREAAPPLPRCVRLIAGDATALPLELGPGSFDVVSALAVLEHLDEPTAALREAHRVLRPGGLLIATCPSPFWDALAGRAGLENPSHHVTAIDLCDLTNLFETTGFRVLEARGFMWLPVAVLPYLGIRASPKPALAIDRIVSRIPLLRQLCVNAFVVGRRVSKPFVPNADSCSQADVVAGRSDS